MLSEMEQRKDDVSHMHEASEEVMDLIGGNSPMSNIVKTQVAEIHDCWNTTVRQVIEAISKVRLSNHRNNSTDKHRDSIKGDT